MNLSKLTIAAVLLVAYSAQAQSLLETTQVSESPIDDIGERRSVKPIQVIPEDDLNSKERTQLSDTLNIVPGVLARSQGSPLLSIRGSQSASRTLVFEDGVPLNFADGVGFNPLFVATENLGSIALLKGPTSSLFGRDAMAGAVEFNSEKLIKSKFYGGYGSFNSDQFFAGAPVGTHAQVTAYYNHTDGAFPYRLPRLGASGTRARNDSELVRSTVEADGHVGESFRWKTFNLIARQIGSTPGSIDFPQPSAFNNWGELNGLTFRANLSERDKLSSRSTFKYLWQNYAGSSPGQTLGARQGLSYAHGFDGLEAEIFDEIAVDQFTALYLSSGAQTLTINEVGLQFIANLNETLSVQPAIRISSETGGIVPSVGFAGTSADGSRYFFAYTEGYRPPSVTEKYAIFPGFQPNPSLASEHSDELSVGFEKEFEPVMARFEAFKRDFNNLIDNRVVSAGVVSPQNVGRAQAYGFDLSASTKTPLAIRAGVTYLENKDPDSGTPLTLSPQFQATAAVTHKTGKLSTTIENVYWSGFYDRSVTTGSLVALDGWDTLDFFFEYEITRGLSLNAAVMNIFDQARELTLGYPEPQRYYTFMVRGYF